MLTGRAVFTGGSVSDTIAAVLGSEPDWDALPKRTPIAVRQLLQRCLEKDPKRRLRDLGDMHFQIDDEATRGRPSSGARRTRAAAVVALVLLAGGAALFYVVKPSVAVTSPSEYVQLTNFSDSATAPSLSPDGRMVTFKRGGDSFLGEGQIVESGDQVSFGAPGELIFRSLAKGNALARIKTDGTGFERLLTVSILDKGDVSPDGEWVIIHTPPTGDRPVVEVMAVPIRGGVPKRICEICITGWSQDGKFFYVSGDVNTSTSSARRTVAIPVPARHYRIFQREESPISHGWRPSPGPG